MGLGWWHHDGQTLSIGVKYIWHKPYARVVYLLIIILRLRLMVMAYYFEHPLDALKNILYSIYIIPHINTRMEDEEFGRHKNVQTIIGISPAFIVHTYEGSWQSSE